MDEGKKELLKEIFWSMNEVKSRTEHRTETRRGVDSGGKTVTVEVTVTALVITVAPKTAEEMAEICRFTPAQRERLAELLAEEYGVLWEGAGMEG